MDGTDIYGADAERLEACFFDYLTIEGVYSFSE
jgi:hypothetical protein